MRRPGRCTDPQLADDTVEGLGDHGQFFLFIALDPEHAEPYIDEPPYRYSRIRSRSLRGAVALGQIDLIPIALLLLNLLAVGAGTLAVVVLLRDRGLSPWYAAFYGLYPGLFVAVSHDLAEPLAYALAALGLLALERRRVPGPRPPSLRARRAGSGDDAPHPARACSLADRGP